MKRERVLESRTWVWSFSSVLDIRREKWRYRVSLPEAEMRWSGSYSWREKRIMRGVK